MIRERPAFDRPRWVRESPHQHWFAVGGICIGAFMIQVDVSVVTLALHEFEVTFDQPLASVQWIALAYVLTIASLVVPMGRVADAVGRKRVFLAGLIVFTLGSIACALSPDLWTLIACRFVQAIGGAAISTNIVAIVTLAMPRDRLRTGLAIQISVQVLALALGPTVGGLLLTTYSWHSIFWINLPVGILAVVIGWMVIPTTNTGSVRSLRLDWTGAVLLALSASGLLLALSAFSGLQLAGLFVAAIAVSAIAALGVLWIREHLARSPLINPELLRHSMIRRGLIGVVGTYLLIDAPLVLVPQVLIPAGHSAATVGPLLAGLPAGFVAAVLTCEFVLKHVSNTQRMVTGAVLTTGALVALAANPLSPIWVVVLMAILGAGLGLYIPANNSTVMGSGPPGATGTVSGMISLGRYAGAALGTALVTFSLHQTGHDSRKVASAEHLVGSARVALLTLAGLALVTCVSALPGRAKREIAV